MDDIETEYISVQETALLLGCCDASVKGALRKGTILGKKVKKHVDVWMVSKASALEYKKNQAKIKGKDDFQTNHKKISIKDASKILGIPRLDFLKLIESGKLKTEGLGYHRVIKKSDFENLKKMKAMDTKKAGLYTSTA